MSDAHNAHTGPAGTGSGGTRTREHLLNATVLEIDSLDHCVLDPQHPSPYPGSAHAVPRMIVPDPDKPGTLSRAPRAP